MFLRSPSHEIKQDSLEIYKGMNWERCFHVAPSLNVICSWQLCCCPSVHAAAARQQCSCTASPTTAMGLDECREQGARTCHDGWMAEPPLLASGKMPCEKDAKHGQHPTLLSLLAPVLALLLPAVNNVTVFSDLKVHLRHHQGPHS